MAAQLQLPNIRNALIRLEETILFGMIERAQFRQNVPVYQPGLPGVEDHTESLLDYMLHECERSHAKVRRYTSPDEQPFFHDLPEPILPALTYVDNPLAPNTINLNDRIREDYIHRIIPLLCLPGDDKQYGSSAVNDVTLIQALSKRIHYGKFVAECKFQDTPDAFRTAIQVSDATRIMALITNAAVEQDVLNRVANKTKIYTGELDELPGMHCITPETACTIYRDWIIPLNKQVQVEYLLQRERHTE